jgi:hypothetical protein
VKSGAAVTLLALVIVVAGVRLLWFYGSKPEAGEPVPHLMPVACEACGKAYVDTVGRQPTKCRFCGEMRAWRAQKCFAADCGVIFPIVQAEGESVVSDFSRCPKCGSSRVGRVPEDEVSQP